MCANFGTFVQSVTIIPLSDRTNINNIERKSFVKYLGVYIDEHLNWETQIQHVNSKLAKKK